MSRGAAVEIGIFWSEGDMYPFKADSFMDGSVVEALSVGNSSTIWVQASSSSIAEVRAYSPRESSPSCGFVVAVDISGQ